MPWTDLDPSAASFVTSNMIIPYQGAISQQFLEKVVENTGFNWNWNRPVCINRSLFASSGDIKRYDSGRDYQNKHIYAVLTNSTVDPGEIATSGWYWDPSLAPGSTDIHRFQAWGLKLTTAWYDLYKAAGYPLFNIRANSSGTGFEIEAQATNNYLWGFVFRIEDNLVDSGTPV
jgi:hypothetical protein